MQPQGLEIPCGGVPKHLIVDPVVSMGEDVPHADDLWSGGNVLEYSRGEIADSEKGFSNDFEFPLKDQLEPTIRKELLLRSPLDEATNFLNRQGPYTRETKGDFDHNRSEAQWPEENFTDYSDFLEQNLEKSSGKPPPQPIF